MNDRVTIAVSAAGADGGKSGIGRYITETLKHLGDLRHPDTRFLVFVTEADRSVTAGLPCQFETRIVSGFWATTVGNILWHLMVLPLIARLNHCDQVMFLAANRRLGPTAGIPSVGVVHDLSQLHVPGKYDRFRTFYVLKLLPVLMRRLDRIVCVSQSTASDVITYVGARPSKVSVNHNGVDTGIFTSTRKTASRRKVRREFGIDEPFILYTARLEHPGKNHITLLDALAYLKSRHQLKHKMVFAGAPWSGAEVIHERIRQLGLADDVILTGFVDDELLPHLVAAADLFVFPSLFEGFGIPVLEAMACGTVVAASNVSSLPEVIGDAGLLFSPTDPIDMANVIAEALSSAEQRRLLARRGRARVKGFSWSRSACELHTVSRRLLYLTAEKYLQIAVGS